MPVFVKRRISYVRRVADNKTLCVQCINPGLRECVCVCMCVRDRERERERERKRASTCVNEYVCVSLCGFGWACGHVISSAVIVKESRSRNSKGEERGREK